MGPRLEFLAQHRKDFLREITDQMLIKDLEV